MGSKKHFLCDKIILLISLLGLLRPREVSKLVKGELGLEPQSSASQSHPSTRKSEVMTPALPMDQLSGPRHREINKAFIYREAW